MHAVLDTSLGVIRIELFADGAPDTVAHFVGLARGTVAYTVDNPRGTQEGPFYDGCTFHNVSRLWLIEAGDPDGDGKETGCGFTIPNEFPTSHGVPWLWPEHLTFELPYRVAMVNLGIPDTASSKFVITRQAMPHLTGRNPVFGEVVDDGSRDVVDLINAVPTDALLYPVTPVLINQLTIEE